MDQMSRIEPALAAKVLVGNGGYRPLNAHGRRPTGTGNRVARRLTETAPSLEEVDRLADAPRRFAVAS